MATVDHPNVELIRRGFNALAEGDIATAVAQFSPQMSHYGADQLGRTREFGSADDLFGMMLEAMALNDEYRNELVDAFAVGDSLVMAHIRGHRRAKYTQAVLDFDYVMVFRIEGGQITRSVELLGTEAESFFARLGTE